MRKYAVLMTAASVVAVAFLSGCSKPAETSAVSPDTKTAIDALTANEVQFAADARAKDVEKIVAHYTATGELLAPGQTPSKNTDVLRYVWRQMTSDPAFALDFKASRIEIAASNDFAYSTGTYTLTATDAATKKPATTTAGYVTVYKKVANGSWKALEDIVTTAPAQAAPASPQVVTDPPPKAAPDTSADEAAIKAQEVQWAADWKAKDAGKIAAHYDAAASALQPMTPAMVGSAAIATGLGEAVKDPALKVDFTNQSVTVAASGDLAYSRGKFTQTATDPKTKKPVSLHGAYVTVWRKQADGSWKAVADAASEEP